MNSGLGKAEIQQLQREGWKFSDRGIRVGNGWMVWTENPQGELKSLLLADPDDEPEKYAEEPHKEDAAQLELFA